MTDYSALRPESDILASAAHTRHQAVNLTGRTFPMQSIPNDFEAMHVSGAKVPLPVVNADTFS